MYRSRQSLRGCLGMFRIDIVGWRKGRPPWHDEGNFLVERSPKKVPGAFEMMWYRTCSS